ncbi:hypothetical protein I302_102656 [Kwoniella bestiolae CBS 10118]|uniref:Uncharacterized protein n=1 Tax=Kwoniella bestiolae CBS 10118 TaxID=1296100 RepID=A0A1B9GFX8_9TREE|nr:hypothetical protein I302_01348 [Kwoniella bestiolae CBS 10118]OCF29835.1 hypothetical protein I302_01348 [Kwoniella bestiolae CBS 10118]
MNKRGPSGLPTKPYMQNNGPGPAPPLPTGPPPPVQAQQQYPQQGQAVDQAAHAAAWAAYYQSQGINPGATYSAGPQAVAAPAGPGTAANPYANYGYGAGAQHSGYQPPVGVGVGVAGPSQPFRPPGPAPNQQPYAAPAAYGQQAPYPQQQAFSPNPTAGYSTPQPQAPVQGQGRPPYNQQQGGYAWGAQQQQPGTPQGYRPPQPQAATYPQQAGPFYPQPSQPQPPQQFTPTGPAGPAGNQPFRPQQQSPYRPPGARPPRPPMSTPHLGGAGVPPAKRPRFDGPGQATMGAGNVRPPNGPMQSTINRPPSAPAAFNAGAGAGVNGGQPGFNTSVSSSRGGARGGAPIPTSRPPIHLGGGGPPPFGIGLGGRGGASMRGGYSGRGGRGGGMAGAPRGPSGMMRRDGNTPGSRSSVPPSSAKKDTPRKEKRREDLRTTMTDFRIVGIEVKGLGWSWGKIGGQEEEEEEPKQEEKIDDQAIPVSTEEGGAITTAGEEVDVNKEEIVGENAVALKADVTSEEVKEEVSETNGDSCAPTLVGGSDVVEEKEKRGEKRKAKSPDSEEETAAKKRNSSYLLTHNKPNNTTIPEPSTSSIFESNQNRFRIYFDSPAELDRIPKSARRKRGRESSSVAPSRAGDHEGEAEAEVEAEAEAEAEVIDEVEEVQRIKEEIEAETQAQAASIASHGEIAVGGEGEGEKTVSEPVEGIEIAALGESASETTDLAATQATEPESQASEVVAEVPEVASEQVADATPSEEVADVSMVTDPGITPTAEASVAINQPVDTTDIAQTDETTEPVQTTAENDSAINTANPEDSASEAAVNGETIQHGQNVESVQHNEGTNNHSAEAKTRARRHSSVSSTDSRDYQSTLAGDHHHQTTHQLSAPARSVPSTNRLSILYEKSLRRICIDSDVVDKVKIWRKEGRIEVELKALEFESKEGEDLKLPKGILVESYDSNDQRYISLNSTSISTFFHQPDHQVPTEDGKSIPPFHKILSTVVPTNDQGEQPTQAEAAPNEVKPEQSDNETIEQPQLESKVNPSSQTQLSDKIILTVYLNRQNPLSEPKWCRNNSADNWLYEQFGSRRLEQDEEQGLKGFGFGTAGWKGKLEVMDPDPAPTLKSILEQWSSTSSYGTSSTRELFISSLLSSPLETIEILLKLTRGDRNPIYSSNPTYFNKSFSSSVIKKDSPYTSHQTHISLAVLAMYRLTTDLVEKLPDEKEREKEKEKFDENVNDIIRSLPLNMIQRSLDGLWKEYSAHGKNGSA